MTRDGVREEPQGLSADAVRVYGLITAGEQVPEESADFVHELTAWGVVVRDEAYGDRLVALDPKEAAQRRLRAELEEAARRVAGMSSLPAVTEQLSAHYDRSLWRAGYGSEYIDDAVVVNARLDDVVGAAEWEILAAQPGGPRTREQLNRSLARDTAALERGVSKRTLYRATVRDNAVTCEYARAMAGRPEGQRAEFRTLVGPFERAIIVDRRVAFISNHLTECSGAPERGAWQITDRAMVAYIAAEFEDRWRRADIWHGELKGRGQQPVDTIICASAPRTTRRQREILRDIVAGRAQQTTANRLGIALRTVTGEIAELKALFGAASLPELTYKWALSPDRLVDDTEQSEAGGGEAA